MGNYDNIVKTEEIRKNVEAGDYQLAQSILDTIELKKIKHTSDLNLFAKVYKENERYDEAAKLYQKICGKIKTRKTIGQLVDISIRKGSTEEAEKYLSEYQKISPEDFDGYIFCYKIEKLKGASYEKLIGILQTLKKIEYNEQWAYELAKVYYKAGMEQECIKECSNIILWFGEGIYVEKARMLRSYYSGETDKERIMEELKRRADQSESKAETEDDSEEAIDTSEEGYTQSEFMTDENEDELEYDLKRDIQDMMIQEEQSTEDASVTEELKEEDEPLLEPNEQEDQFEDQEDELIEDQHEVQDEDDLKLLQIAEENRFDPEEVFGNFLHISLIKKQVVKSLEMIIQDSKKPVIMIITGSKGSGKTTMAKDLALFLSKTGRIKSAKVAKITADKLNTVDLDSKKEILRSCCMVVEYSSELKRETIEKLLGLTKQLQGDIAVVFEEDKKNMNRLFRECPKLMDILKVRIHLPQYTEEDILSFAMSNLKQKDYYLSQKAEAILKNKLKQITKQTEPSSQLSKINELIQTVMNAADIRTGKQLTELAAQGRLKDVGILTILPEDINC